MTTSSRPLYRSRHGWLFGVCEGLADYSQIPVGWIRVLVIFLAIFTAFWPTFFGYIIAAILMKPAPHSAPVDDEDWEFYNAYISNRKMALSRLKRKFDNLDRRTSRIESIVTDKEYDWERRFQSGS